MKRLYIFLVVFIFALFPCSSSMAYDLSVDHTWEKYGCKTPETDDEQYMTAGYSYSYVEHGGLQGYQIETPNYDDGRRWFWVYNPVPYKETSNDCFCFYLVCRSSAVPSNFESPLKTDCSGSYAKYFSWAESGEPGTLLHCKNYYQFREYSNVNFSPNEYLPNPNFGNAELFNMRTNLPVFVEADDDFVERVNAYIADGDTTGAANHDALEEGGGMELEPIEHEECGVQDVEPISNIHTKGTLSKIFSGIDSLNTKKIGVLWNRTQNMLDKNYSYDVQMRVRYIDGSDNAKIITTDWKTFVSDYPYDTGNLIYFDPVHPEESGNPVSQEPGSESFTFGLSDIDAMTPHTLVYDPVVFGTHDVVVFVDIRVRNRDDSAGMASRWAKIRCKSDKISDEKEENTVTREDSDGNVYQDDPEYHGQDVDNSGNDTYYEYDPSTWVNKDKDKGNYDFSSIDGIFDFIRGGFGLLGDYGLISLMSSVFSYIPASIWTMIKCYVGIMIVVAIVALFKKFTLG